MKPPTLRSLLDDPVYRTYVKTIPTLSETLRDGKPWMVWARLTTGAWRGAQVATYRDGWSIVVKALRSSSYEDVSIISRRQFFGPPQGMVWETRWFKWCGRCRRPSSFIIRPRHHALIKAVAVTTDDAKRCYFCGIRLCAMPDYRI